MKMDGHSDVTLVVTSCRRFDLLEKTLASMHPWLGRFPNRILVEDSSDRPQFLNDLESDGFSILINGSRLGQHKSIDNAYDRVETEFVFHCEDDWEFLVEPNFHAAKYILKNGIDGHKRVSVVTFRDTTGNKENNQSAYIEYEMMGSRYRYSFKQKSKYNSFTFNPTVLRRDLREVTGPYAEFLTEGSIARYLRRREYVVVTQVPGVVRHIGDDRGVKRQRHNWRSRLSQRFRKGV